MLVDFLLAAIVAAAFGTAGAMSAVKFVLSKNEVMWKLRQNTEHPHRFDTMLGDGKGWRCGTCGKPRKAEKAK